jgi:plastocyanin
MVRSIALAAVGAVAILASAASPAPASTDVVVEITDRGFSPGSIEAAPGAVVEWRNSDRHVHTVTAENSSFDSGPLEPGAAFSVTFEAAGTYTYSSTAEGDDSWIGTVVVREASPEPESPPAEAPDDLPSGPPASPDDRPTLAPSPDASLDEPLDPPAEPRAAVPAEGPVGGTGEELAAAVLPAGGGPVTVAQSAPTVTIVDSAFQPREVEVSPGTTVVWEQVGELPHTVTADDDSFDSGEMGQGDTYSRAFPQSGTFPYFCRFHGGPGGAGMAGVVVVSGGDGGPSGSGGDGGTDGAPDDGGTGSTLAETGAGTVGPLAAAVVALLGTGSGCLLLDRRRRAAALRPTAVERARLVPGGMWLG